MPLRAIGILLISVLASLPVDGGGAHTAAKSFVLDSTASTYPFVIRLEGFFARKGNDLQITVEKGLVRSAIPEDVGTDGRATNIQIAMGLGKKTTDGWTMDIETLQQFVAMKLAPGETSIIGRRTFVIKGLPKAGSQIVGLQLA